MLRLGVDPKLDRFRILVVRINNFSMLLTDITYPSPIILAPIPRARVVISIPHVAQLQVVSPLQCGDIT